MIIDLSPAYFIAILVVGISIDILIAIGAFKLFKKYLSRKK